MPNPKSSTPDPDRSRSRNRRRPKPKALPSIPPPASEPEPSGKPDDLRFIERLEVAQLKHDFATNDIVRASLRQAPRVNGRPLDLGTHGLTLLLLLAARAKRIQGDFLSTEEIVLALEHERRTLGAMRMSWETPTKASVYSAVTEIRAALEKNGLNGNLIELVTGKGYRLSTPAMNIIIDAPGSDGLGELTWKSLDGGNGNALPDYRRPLH
jgi:DNA-binding response OmpR family regulator